MNRRDFILALGATIGALPFTYVFAADRTSGFEDYLRGQLDGFTSYKDQLNKDFETYQKATQEAFSQYKNAIYKKWGDQKIGSATELVTYNSTKNARTLVDYKNATITVEVVTKEGEASAKAKLQEQLLSTLNATVQDEFNKSELDQTVERAVSQNTTNKMQAKPDARPVVADVLEKKHIDDVKPEQRKGGEPGTQIFSITVPLNQAKIDSRSNDFYPLAKKYAEKEQIPVPLVLAIIHTESCFNTLARSHVPAYGLMQIVPTSAGKDASQKVYGQAKLLSPSYLYNSENNIQMGCAYLNILYYRYLAKIENPTSRMYCSIAAYNTGAGNVARAFNGTTNINTAAVKINTMQPNQVYQHLVKHLPYQETKDYMERVTSRYLAYSKEFSVV